MRLQHIARKSIVMLMLLTLLIAFNTSLVAITLPSQVLAVDCTSYRYMGVPTCTTQHSKTRVPYSSRVHIVRPIQKFVPANTIKKPAVINGKKMNKRAVRARYYEQQDALPK